jgi:hypothetical protein
VHTFEDVAGAMVSCSLVAEARVDRQGRDFSAMVQFRLADEDPGCREPFVHLAISSTDSSGDPQEVRSDSFGSTLVTLTATDVADDVEAAVSVAFPNCRPFSGGCTSGRELGPK